MALIRTKPNQTMCIPSRYIVGIKEAPSVAFMRATSCTSSYIFPESGYEWDIGHFRGAKRPDVDCFRRTSFGLSEEEVLPFSWHNS